MHHQIANYLYPRHLNIELYQFRFSRWFWIGQILRDLVVRFVKFCFVSVCVSLAGCAGLVTSPLPSKNLTADYELDGINWQGGGLMVLAFKVFEQDGKVALCGARSVDRKKKLLGEDLNDRAIETISISLEDKTLVSNLRFFNQVPFPGNQANSLKGEANCVLTTEPWKPEFGILFQPKLNRGSRNIIVQG